MNSRTIIKYQWTEKQQAETLEIMAYLKELVYKTDIWKQIEESPQHDKHDIRCKLEGLIRRVKAMRKITEEY